VICLFGFTAMSGCTSMKRVTLSPTEGGPAFGRIRVGDTVSVRLSNGSEHRFAVAAIEGDTLVGSNGTRVARADIVEAKRRSTSVIKTSFLTAGVAVGGFFLVAFILFATHGTLND
jgi:hypothetical protein